MAERTVKVRLSAQVQEYIDGMARAADATRKTGSEGEKLAQQREAFNKLGGALTAVGGATTALYVAALKTGIEYNTLQQTSRAALKTMLGSTQAVNEQMDKLDAFAKTSPFSKGMFIQAQQQMLAFGIETKKVIPYLDAMQNAVAAAGGSNEDIAQMAELFSKISSASKITGQDLQQFGRMGVDAAEIIGERMGKTAGQIRSEITAGTLDADAALDALAQGMATKFDGAAANVKETFAGAMDRVKAAWRDFGAELARPLVDPEGGGMLVDFLNGLADAMRGFEKLPAPLKNAITLLTGVGGAVALVGGSLLLALPQIVAFQEAMVTLQVVSRAKDMLSGFVQFMTGPWGIAMATAALTVYAFNQAMDASKVSSEQLENSLRQGKNALDVMRETAAKNETGLTRLFVDVSQHAEKLGPLLDKAADSGRGFFSSLTFNEQAMLSNLSDFGDVLASLAFEDLPRAQREFKNFADGADLTTEQMIVLLNEMGPFKSELIDYAEAAGLATDDTTLLGIALGEIDTEPPRQGLEDIQNAAVDTSFAVEGLSDQLKNFGKESIDAERAAIKFEEELQKLATQVEGNTGGLDINTEAGRANRESLLAMAEQTNRTAAAFNEAGRSQDEVTGALDRGRDALIRAAKQFGMTKEEAEAYADALIATPESVQTSVRLNGVTEAENTLAGLVRDRIARISVRSDSSATPSMGGYASGGMIAYANGGIEAFATGGLSAGIYRGGAPIHKLAEPETGWEAYISGRKGQEVRNRQVWVESGNRLGVFDDLKKMIVGMGAGPSLAGQRLSLVVEGHEFTAYVDERADGVVAARLPSRSSVRMSLPV